jgi:hypothetical protein
LFLFSRRVFPSFVSARLFLRVCFSARLFLRVWFSARPVLRARFSASVSLRLVFCASGSFADIFGAVAFWVRHADLPVAKRGLLRLFAARRRAPPV